MKNYFYSNLCLLISSVMIAQVVFADTETVILTSLPSEPFKLNADIEDQPFFFQETEPIFYSGKFQTYDTTQAKTLKVTVTTDGKTTVLKEVPPTQAGSFELRPADYSIGYHLLKHDILNSSGEVLASMEKRFTVLDPSKVEIHTGNLYQTSTWTSNKVHIICHSFHILSARTLTINPGTVVKFCTGASINIAYGADCIANGVIFTHINDDIVGGDTLGDGRNSTPMNSYAINGDLIYNEKTDFRFILLELPGVINRNVTLRANENYIVPKNTIILGGTLTIPPGTVLKMGADADIVIKSGATLSALGTRAAPIVFTSIKDDTYNGDTNGDGEATFPQAGDWRQIRVDGGTFNASYVSLFYLSNDNNQGGIYVNSGNVNLDGCTVAHCNFDCMRSTGGTSIVRNSIFTDSSMGVAPRRGSSQYINCVFNGLTTAVRWSNGTFINCIFSNISRTFFDSAGSSPKNNCVFWNPEGYGPQKEDIVGTNGNIWGDPLFLDPESGDFRISANSPCVDAADSDVAPEYDYYGQPRVTLTPGHGGEKPAADIGVYEVISDDVQGKIDFVPVSVSAETNAVPGKIISLEWKIMNKGENEIKGSWRDTISLVTSYGSEIKLGDQVTTATMASGASLSCSGVFTVPAMSEGTYYPKVNLNSYHDIFEGVLSTNNVLVSYQPINVELESFDPNESNSGIIHAGTNTVLKFSFSENNDNRMMRFSLPARIKVSWGFGFMPSEEASSGSVVSGDYDVLFLVPEGTTEVYVTLESDRDVKFDYSTTNERMVISGVSPSTLPSSGMSTIIIYGAGFGETNLVTLLNGETSFKVQDATRDQNGALVATVDCSALQPGKTFNVKVESDENIAEIQNAIFVKNEKGKGEFWAKLIVPDSVRPGRRVSCYIEYGNSGNADVPAQILQVNVKGDGLLQYIENPKTFKAIHFVAATTAQGKIAPGDSSKIAFILLSGNSNYISLYSNQPDNEEEICAAVSRVYSIGADNTDFRLVYNQLSPDTAIDLKTYEDYTSFLKDKDGGSKLDVIIEDLDSWLVSVSAKNIETGETYVSHQIDGNVIKIAGLKNGLYKIVAETDNTIGISYVSVLSPYESVSLKLNKSIEINGFVPDPDEEDIITFISYNYVYYSPINPDGTFKIKIPSDEYDISIITSSDNKYKTIEGIELNANTNLVFEAFEKSSVKHVLSNNNTSFSSKINSVGFRKDYDDSIFESKYTQALKRYDEGLRLFNIGMDYLVPPVGDLDCVHNREIYYANRRIVFTFMIKLQTYYNNIKMSDPTKFAAMSSRTLYGGSQVVFEVIKLKYTKGIPFAGVVIDKMLDSFKADLELIGKEYSIDLLNDAFEAMNSDVHKLRDLLKKPELSISYANDLLNGISTLSKYNSEGAKEMFSSNPVLYAIWERAFQESNLYAGFSQFIGLAGALAELTKDLLNISDSGFEWGYARWHINDWMGEFEHEIEDFAQKLPLKQYYELCCFVKDYEDLLFSKKAEYVFGKMLSVPHSCDPNEMFGPLGIGDPETERFVVPGEWLTYTVYFENTSNATAAAQEVRVTNPLNEYLDWSTFEMDEIVFNNQIDLGLAGKQSGTSEVAANGTNYNVRTQLELDKEKGEVKWYMRIVDPSTETGWPDDILVGFLPPNDETYRGEGHLSYRIKVREDAPAGVTINNSATIVFDYNDPIETDPAWWNKVAKVNTIEIEGGTNVNLVVGLPFGELPVPEERKGWIFIGWFTGPDGTGRQITEDSLVEEGDTALYQYWERERHDLDQDDETQVVTDVYNGYLYDPNNYTVMGSISINVMKPKNDNAKVSGTVVMAGGIKTEIKGSMPMSTGHMETTTKSGKKLTLDFSSNGLIGKLDELEIDGSRNVFVSKQPADQAAANSALASMGGVYTVAWEDGTGYAFASVTVGKKGVAKATGFMANGVKFSASGQLLLGKEENCVNLVSKSKKAPLAFNLWLTPDEPVEPDGLNDSAISAKLIPLMSGSSFVCDYLVNPIPVTIQGNKWTTATSKDIALKLSYNDKTGLFKGSFNVGKQKAIVNGVVVDGIGYGSANLKQSGTKPVLIKQ